MARYMMIALLSFFVAGSVWAQTPDLDAKKKEIEKITQEMGVAGSPEEYDALKKKYDAAVAEYKQLKSKVQSENDQDVACKSAINACNTAFKEKDYATARTQALAALKTCPDNPKAQYMLGLSEKKLGNYPAALAALDKAARLEPNDTRALLEKARLLAGEMKRTKDAADVLDAMIAKHPKEAKPWFEKGKIFLEQKNFELAIPALEQAVNVEPGFSRGWVVLAQACVESHDCNKALSAVEQALKDKANKDISEVYFQQAAAANQCAQYDKALAASDACLANIGKLKQNKSYVQGGAHFEKGVAYSKKGQTPAALKAFQEAAGFLEWRQSANYEIDAIKKDQGN
ncbi:MAG: tetratricopeptide repeat protein [Candidatus Delongbacteria bacterium]